MVFKSSELESHHVHCNFEWKDYTVRESDVLTKAPMASKVSEISKTLEFEPFVCLNVKKASFCTLIMFSN